MWPERPKGILALKSPVLHYTERQFHYFLLYSPPFCFKNYQVDPDSGDLVTYIFFRFCFLSRRALVAAVRRPRQRRPHHLLLQVRRYSPLLFLHLLTSNFGKFFIIFLFILWSLGIIKQLRERGVWTRSHGPVEDLMTMITMRRNSIGERPLLRLKVA
jgi:hypothetical protein